MGTITYTALDDLINLLHNNWGGSGDAGREPVFEKSWERRSVGFGSDTREGVFVTPRQENIQYFGISPMGINVYEFDYKDKSYGSGRYSGVMAQEVPWAAERARNGY